MSSLSNLLSSALGAAHLSIGILSLAAPVWTAINIFRLAPGRPVPIATRIGGSRDVFLGAWLLFFCAPGERKRLAATLGLINATDIISAIACYWEGSMSFFMMKNVATASTIMSLIGILAWRL
ncbi:hypothetical protein N7522_004061 [Penicillium canescens]|nr:hypothetical protein N7522_004061 [Penicillium canescens]